MEKTIPQRAEAHISILPSPGMGHLIPLIEFAKKLLQVQNSNFTITFIIPYDGSSMKPQKALLESLLPSINSIFLPPVNFDDLPEDSKMETRISLSVIRSLPALHQVLSDFKESNRFSVFVVDLFGPLTFDMVKELGIPSYIFFPSTAMLLSFAFELPQLDESCTCEYRDLFEPVQLPGCIPLNGSDLTDTVQDRTNEAYKGAVEMCRMYPLADGILVNSFFELEPETFKALNQLTRSCNRPPVYPVGPLVRTGSSMDNSGERAECLRWLDEQPVESVLFISFGSGGTLSREQLNELALGLEMSGQRFLLVAKRPNDKARNATYFISNENEIDTFDFDFVQFVERTKTRCFVLNDWAPQIEVLSHRAVGGFLMHCGWNSTLEGIMHGVPLIAWPLYAEQKMNSVLLSEKLKIAIRVIENKNGMVDSEQIAKLARSLILGEEGKEIRDKVRNLKDVAKKALSQYGSSSNSLAKVLEKWTSGANNRFTKFLPISDLTITG